MTTSRHDDLGMQISVSFAVGLLLYAVAFFLPAVGSYSGWQCARIVSGAFFTLPQTLGNVNALLIALLNPLVVLFVIRELTGRLAGARVFLTVLIIISIGATWVLLFGSEGDDLRIRIGHMLWVGGILLIIAPELTRWKVSGHRAG